MINRKQIYSSIIIIILVSIMNVILSPKLSGLWAKSIIAINHSRKNTFTLNCKQFQQHARMTHPNWAAATEWSVIWPFEYFSGPMHGQIGENMCIVFANGQRGCFVCVECALAQCSQAVSCRCAHLASYLRANKRIENNENNLSLFALASSVPRSIDWSMRLHLQCWFGKKQKRAAGDPLTIEELTRMPMADFAAKANRRIIIYFCSHIKDHWFCLRQNSYSIQRIRLKLNPLSLSDICWKGNSSDNKSSSDHFAKRDAL